MSSKKRLLWLILLIPLLLITLPVILALTIDPNRLKTVLEQAAAKKGLDLSIAGDIEWQLYPSVGFSLGEVTLTEAAGDAARPLAKVDQASVSVALLPLLRREVQIDGIALHDAQVNLLVDVSGRGNWESLTGAPQEAPAATPEPSSGETPELTIDRLSLSNLNLNYDNAQSGDQISVAGITVNSQNLALNGQSFPLEVQFEAQLQDLPALAVNLSGPVALNLDEQRFSTSGTRLQLVSGEARAEIALSNETHWADALKSTGKLDIQPLAVRPWLKAFDIQPAVDDGSLGNFSLSAPFSIEGNRYELPELQIKIDETDIKGRVLAHLAETIALDAQLQGSRINLDRYLPAAEEEAAATQDEPAAEATPLPLEPLRNLKLNLTAGFEQLTFRQLDFVQPQLMVSGNNGLIRLENLSTQLSGGTVQSQGTLDARGEEAQLKLNLESQGVDVNTLLRTLADFDALQGKAQLTADLASHGATSEALIKNMNMTAQAASQELRLVPINLEQQFCQALALVQGKTLPEDFQWPDRTEFEPITLQLKLAEETLNLVDLSAQISNLVGKAEGVFSLETGQFNVPFRLSLGDFASSLPGCLPIEEKWRSFALPIRCKGSLDSIGPTTCLPDRELITTMIKDRATAKVRGKVEKEQDRLEQKAEDKAKELLKEKLGDERTKAAEESIRGLLNKVKPKSTTE